MSPLVDDNRDNDEEEEDESTPGLIINLWDSDSQGKVTASSVLAGLFPDVERLHQAVPPLGHHQVHQGGRSTCTWGKR